VKPESEPLFRQQSAKIQGPSEHSIGVRNLKTATILPLHEAIFFSNIYSIRSCWNLFSATPLIAKDLHQTSAYKSDGDGMLRLHL
jgi:hypothetical protein